MPVEFLCPSCAKPLRVADEFAGRQARCPACESICQVPAPFPPAASPFADLPLPSASSNPFADAPYPRSGPVATSNNPYQSPATNAAGMSYRRTDRLGKSASRGLRFIGNLLHTLITFGPLFLLVIAGAVVADAQGNEDLVGIFLVVGGLISGALQIVNWVMISTSGQSIAKRILGMRIVGEDGRLPGFGKGVLLRSWLPAGIGMLCGWFGLIDALWIFGEESRCLHDLMAGTRVVVVERTQIPRSQI